MKGIYSSRLLMLFLSLLWREMWHAMSEVVFSGELNFLLFSLVDILCFFLLVSFLIDVMWHLWYLFFK